MSRFVLLH